MNPIAEFKDAQKSAALTRLLSWQSSKTSRTVSTQGFPFEARSRLFSREQAFIRNPQDWSNPCLDSMWVSLANAGSALGGRLQRKEIFNLWQKF